MRFQCERIASLHCIDYTPNRFIKEGGCLAFVRSFSPIAQRKQTHTHSFLTALEISLIVRALRWSAAAQRIHWYSGQLLNKGYRSPDRRARFWQRFCRFYWWVLRSFPKAKGRLRFQQGWGSADWLSRWLHPAGIPISRERNRRNPWLCGRECIPARSL